MAEFNFKSIFKGKIPIIYLRVSSQAQQQRGSGVVSQRKSINDWLKLNGVKKAPIVFKETGSGGNESSSRKEWGKMIDFIKEQKKPSQYFVIMRDFTRWSRHVVFGPEAFAFLYRNGVELVSVTDNIATGSEERLDADGEFMFGLWTALGSRERTGGRKRVLLGVETAREELGVIGGQPLDVEGEFRTLLKYEKDLRDGVVGYTAVGKDRMTWRSPRTRKPDGTRGGNNPRGRSWMVNAMDRFDRIRKGGFDVEEWIDNVERVKKIRDQFGPKSKEFLAVQRMTSGFIKKPSEFWNRKPSDEDYENYIQNADVFQTSKGR